LRAWLRKNVGKNPKVRPSDLPASIEVSNGHFYNTRREILAEAPAPKALAPKAPKALAPKAPKKPSATAKVIQGLQKENAYLRWCLEGERNGFLDRFLEDQG